MKNTKNFQNIMKKSWIFVPVIAFLGIGAGFIPCPYFESGYFGVLGCVAASFLLGFIAYTKPRRDIVSLMAPLYAVLIFNPWSQFSQGIVMQVLYALTLLAMAYRLERLFGN